MLPTLVEAKFNEGASDRFTMMTWKLSESVAAFVDDLKRDRGLQFSTRIAVLSLFGMMNWIYTWHNPRVDADAISIADEMTDIFLRGVMTGERVRKER